MKRSRRSSNGRPTLPALAALACLAGPMAAGAGAAEDPVDFRPLHGLGDVRQHRLESKLDRKSVV